MTPGLVRAAAMFQVLKQMAARDWDVFGANDSFAQRLAERQLERLRRERRRIGIRRARRLLPRADRACDLDDYEDLAERGKHRSDAAWRRFAERLSAENALLNYELEAAPKRVRG